MTLHLLPRGTRTPIVAGLAGALLATGCGGSTEAAEDPAATSPSPTSSAATPAAPTATPAAAPTAAQPTYGAGIEDGNVQIVLTHRGQELRGDAPAGSPLEPCTTPIALGQAGDGWMVSQEGGDSDQRTLYLASDGRIVAATVTGGVPFGGGFLPQSATPYLTWVAKTGLGDVQQGRHRAAPPLPGLPVGGPRPR